MSESKLLDALIAQAKLSKKQTEKQQKIVEAAITIFAEKGYANTSTSEIAKAAGVAEGTIFRHYGTKDNLLLSVILPFFKESFPIMAEEVFNEIMSSNVHTFEEFLKAFLKNRINFFFENKEIAKVVIKEILYNEELKSNLLPILSENFIIRVNKALDIFKERGEFVDIPTDRIVKMVLTFIAGFLASRLVLLNDYSITEEEIEDAVRFVMDGIRNKEQ
ncbi:TetR/AcrR family transcriptional regulator [Metabacillus halosaccharovorans]|uniref:TetR/AcrR family transcriptional regulator n=1 Tax=Metabacillus halosaccharovorans TaxID=930124 RepID=UPI0009951AD3|nr:TetR/AcrR family transcriptional regulator [Metabacillus halosaccharovorans]